MAETATQTRVLGLDAGEQTGFALVIVENGVPKLQSYGVIPVTQPGRLGVVQSVYSWLSTHVSAVNLNTKLCFSEIVQMRGCPTSHAAIEAQGVIRLWGAVGYHPATIHSQLGTRRKADVAGYLEKLFGVRVRPDHAADACAAALCHGIKIGAITKLDFAPEQEPVGLRAPKGKQVADDHEPTREEVVEMLKTGKARVA